jgi:hypothetical protein
MTGSLYYPPADRTVQWFGSGNATVTPTKILWHSTETAGGWPGYSAGATAPNLTYDPWLHQWRQHFPLNGTSRALANGTNYSTNRQGTVQVEISCTNGWSAVAVAKGRAVWNLDDRAIGDLAAFSKFMNVEWGVPLSTSVDWPSYPGVPARLSPAAFTAYRGHVGHMHTPYQDHGDPGGLAVARILAAANGSVTLPKDPLMPLTDTQALDLLAAARDTRDRVRGGDANVDSLQALSMAATSTNQKLDQISLLLVEIRDALTPKV